jgi:colanic acid biosynthesis glycosyl transferase WcaI
MRIIIHDYPGHAFPVQLSRHLAAQGHEVWHLWSADIEAPRGPLARRADDPATLTLLPLSLGKPLAKYNLIKRFFTERAYAKLFIQTVAPLQPEVVLSNPSPFIQGAILSWAKANGVAFVSWLQDVYYLPLAKLLQQKLPYLGALPVAVVKWYELKVLRQSTHTITIAPAFNEFLMSQGQAAETLTCIGNWPILEEMPVLPKANVWAKRHGVEKTFNFVYSGTLGLKHNPQLLVDLAQQFSADAQVRLIIVTQGLGRQFLETAKAKHGLQNLILLDYQPFEELPQVLASADVLVSLLEPEAGVFSVPSKILNYLCAGRPVLGAMPLVNQASKTILEAKAGIVVKPTDAAGFLAAAQQLRQGKAATTMGQAGRKYAETHYAIAAIGAQFEKVFTRARQTARG